MSSLIRWVMETSQTPWQAITVSGSPGQLAERVVQ